jgi:hypothetical protein
MSDSSQSGSGQWIEDAVANATAHADNLQRMKHRDRRRYVRKVMKEARVIYAIWYDDDNRYIFCIKGIATPEGTRASMHAIFVKSEADALGMRREWGDGELPSGVQ